MTTTTDCQPFFFVRPQDVRGNTFCYGRHRQSMPHGYLGSNEKIVPVSFRRLARPSEQSTHHIANLFFGAQLLFCDPNLPDDPLLFGDLCFSLAIRLSLGAPPSLRRATRRRLCTRSRYTPCDRKNSHMWIFVGLKSCVSLTGSGSWWQLVALQR